MTEGHKHRTVKVERGGLVHRALTRPLKHFACDVGSPVYNRIDRSPYPYGPCEKHTNGESAIYEQCYYLSALSILHRWIGLTLDMQPVPDE